MFSLRLLSEFVRKQEQVISAGAIMDLWVGLVLLMRTGSSLPGDSSKKQAAFDLFPSFVFIERDLACS